MIISICIYVFIFISIFVFVLVLVLIFVFPSCMMTHDTTASSESRVATPGGSRRGLVVRTKCMCSTIVEGTVLRVEAAVSGANIYGPSALPRLIADIVLNLRC
jgi:hypothetical protein